MAPIQLDPEVRWELVALVPAHALAAAGLTYGVARSLLRSHRGLGPAQDTRDRSIRRTRQVTTFAALVAVSLACAAYASVQYALLSYKVWASERDVDIPSR